MAGAAASGAVEEALKYAEAGKDGKEAVKLSKDELVQKALSCPCLDDVREGACGQKFMAAFECFIRSDTPDRGSDCYPVFEKLHKCIAMNPEGFVGGDDD